MTYFVVSLVYYQYRKGIKLLVIFPFFFPLTLAQQDSNSTLQKRLTPTKIFFFSKHKIITVLICRQMYAVHFSPVQSIVLFVLSLVTEIAKNSQEIKQLSLITRS